MGRGADCDQYPDGRARRRDFFCRTRHEQALRASLELSATVYVAHLNSLPLIRNKGYLADFAERAAEFWTPYADMAAASGAVIALENMWERSPDLQRRVVETAGHPALRASFDNGHAQVFSDVPAPEWIAALGESLAHCHLHDNDGQYDAHEPVGDGIADWPALLEALARSPAQPMIVLESDRLERNRASLEAWQEMTASS